MTSPTDYDALNHEPGNRGSGALVKDPDEYLDPVTGLWRRQPNAHRLTRNEEEIPDEKTQ